MQNFETTFLIILFNVGPAKMQKYMINSENAW